MTALELRLADRRAASPRPSAAWSPAAALVGVAVHLSTAAIAALGVVLVWFRPHWAVLVAGLLLLGIAAGLAPRPHRRPRDVGALDRTTAPRLFDLLDQIATVTGTPVAQEVWVHDGFAPSAGRVGWRRTPVIGVGASLWVPASPAARVALLAHEAAHLTRVHPVTRWCVDPARQTLRSWWGVFDDAGAPRFGPQWFLQTTMMVPGRLVVAGCLHGLARLEAPAHAHVEAAADQDATACAGTAGATELLDLLLCQGVVEAATTRAALRSTDRRPDVWGEVRGAIAAVTEEDREVRRACPAPHAVRVDAEHPATALRLAATAALPRRDGSVRPDAELVSAIDAELADLLADAARAAADRVRSRDSRRDDRIDPAGLPEWGLPPAY